MASTPSVKSQKEGECYSDSISELAYVGRENLSTVVPPSKEYEGHHVWDPSATWTPEEERRVRRKIDFRLLTMVCLMVSSWIAFSVFDLIRLEMIADVNISLVL